MIETIANLLVIIILGFILSGVVGLFFAGVFTFFSDREVSNEYNNYEGWRK